MAQFVPSPATVSAETTGHAPDDADAQTRLPSICVDYLSHEWDEEDVWTSWRSMTKHKNDISNGIRLENASWRTWWKQRNKLKTISPETLNWLKDSDVTWLYGPLHTAVDPVPKPKASTLEDHIDLDQGHGTKPILKHRTISELLTMPSQQSPSIDAIPDDDQSDVPSDFQSDTSPGSSVAASPTEPKRPKFQVSHSEPLIKAALHNSDSVNQQYNESESSKHMTPNPTTSDGDASNSSGASKRHITFNNFVEQRISLDEPERVAEDPIASPNEENFSSEDEGLTFRSRSTSNNISSKSRTRSSSVASDLSSIPAPDHITIAEIEPTQLKTNPHGSDDEDNEYDVVPEAPGDSNPDYVPTARRSSFYNNSSDEDSPVSQPSAALRAEPPLASPAHGFHPGAWEDNDEFDYFTGRFDDFDDDDDDDKEIEDISQQPPSTQSTQSTQSAHQQPTDQLTLVLDPLNRPREVSKKHQRRRSSVLRALGKGGIPADASVDHKRKSSLLSLLDEPASTEQQNVRRRGSILEAIKRRSSSSNDSHTTAVDEESEQVEGLGEQAQQQEEEKGPTFNLNWYETGDETHKDDEHQGTQKPRRWSTQDTDLAQHKPFPLYINDQALTSINVPFSKITSIHTTQLKRDKSTTITPPGSPNSRKASVAFEQPETPLNEKEKAHEKSIPSEGSRKIASKPATIEIEVHDPSNTRHNQSNGTVSFEFWDTLSGQVEADIVLKYIDMVRKNNNQAPQDIKRAAKDLVQSEERTHERSPIA
ncbi:hypothetical protein E3P92_03139 [Wallemia ichthyophaga]|nr:hypothetical protein E3P92_03139 [Wallemia ichthyophaga]